MGFMRNLVNSVDNTQQNAAEVKETLGMLVSLAETKGAAFEEKIKSDLATGKTLDNLTVAISKVIASKVEYRTYTKLGTTDILSTVTKSLGDMFSGDASVLSCIGNLLNTGLSAIMGAGEGYEAESHSYLVVAEYPAIVRFDFACWGRNISAKSIKTYVENAFACVAYKSSVDTTKLSFSDFLTLYGPVLRGAFGTDQAKLKQMIVEAKEVYDMFAKGDLTAHAALQSPAHLDMTTVGNIPHREVATSFFKYKPTVGSF